MNVSYLFQGRLRLSLFTALPQAKTHSHENAHMYTDMCIYMRIYLFVSIYIYIYIYMNNIYIFIYIYCSFTSSAISNLNVEDSNSIDFIKIT